MERKVNQANVSQLDLTQFSAQDVDKELQKLNETKNHLLIKRKISSASQNNHRDSRTTV